MISLKQNDMITLQNQTFLQSDIMDSINNSSSAIIRITDWNQEVVENGDINVQYNLAISYENGEGTEMNLKKAENGNIAQKNLGWIYENGFGAEKNLEKAFYWYQKAAENGNIDAQHRLGWLY